MGTRRNEIIGSAVVFGVCIAVLTALRVWDVEPVTAVQSAIVNLTALSIVAFVSYTAYRGSDFISGWIAAFGPSLAFALNLFVTVSTMGLVLKLGVTFISAVGISVVLAGVGYAAGYGLKRVSGTADSYLHRERSLHVSEETAESRLTSRVSEKRG